MGSDNTAVKQDGFNSQIGFIIACVGSAVGMGNLWRFPVLVSAWGGMTFLIPYFLFVILIGSTGVVERKEHRERSYRCIWRCYGTCRKKQKTW